MILVILWLVFAVLVGVVAGKYGRSSLGWSILALAISPLIAGLILIVVLLPGKNKNIYQKESLPYTEATKKCPFCAEFIMLDAIKCKHCGSDISSTETKFEKEHSFTITCYECSFANEINSSTVHNFPTCFKCGKPMINLKRARHTDSLLKYISTNKKIIHPYVYARLYRQITGA